MTTQLTTENGTFVGSSHALEDGDKVITNYNGQFGSWCLNVIERSEIGSKHEDWYQLCGDWDGATTYDLWYSFETSTWMMGVDGQSVRVFKE